MFFINKFGNEHAVYLIFGVIAIGILFYYVYHWKQKKMLEFAKIESAKKIFETISNKKRILKKILLIKVLHNQGIAKRDDISVKNCKMKCLW